MLKFQHVSYTQDRCKTGDNNMSRDFFGLADIQAHRVSSALFITIYNKLALENGRKEYLSALQDGNFALTWILYGLQACSSQNV